MTSLATHAKRFIGPLLANRWTAIFAAPQATGGFALIDRHGLVVVLKLRAA